ncbi:AAA family ATPase [Lysinibacillus sp. NPDC097195]|uniref:AAA family ATPase n=1 Tax=Lysinibacillus sp. NPDC097195 TaxID=3364141 RepID=UPI00380639B7
MYNHLEKINKTIKIKQIRLENIKNINSGTIDFFKNDKPLNIIGLYGQNGSGKTALVNALDIIKTLFIGRKMQKNVIDLLPLSSEATIEIIFEVPKEREIYYKVELRRATSEDLRNENLINEENEKGEISIKVVSEKLETRNLETNSRKKVLLGYESENEDYPLITKNLFPKNKINSSKLEYVKAMSISNQESFIFGTGMRKFIKEYKNKRMLDELREVLNLLSIDFARNLFIYSNDFSGMIYTNILLPISFSVGINASSNASGTLPLPSNKSSIISKKHFELANIIFEQINGVLPNIIPDLTIEIEELEKRKLEDGNDGYSIEIMANRNGHKFPFRCESDGIKKIVSILSTLISVYNTPNATAVIDEFDSGIFEYLLGELVSVMSSSAKGLLIFTSHNLRALEVLNPEEIVFTTTNPDNRYIKITNVKKTNNLRAVYLKAIQLGGFSENLYAQTDTFSIQNNFRRTYKKMKKNLQESKINESTEKGFDFNS